MRDPWVTRVDMVTHPCSTGESHSPACTAPLHLWPKRAFGQARRSLYLETRPSVNLWEGTAPVKLPPTMCPGNLSFAVPWSEPGLPKGAGVPAQIQI